MGEGHRPEAFAVIQSADLKDAEAFHRHFVSVFQRGKFHDVFSLKSINESGKGELDQLPELVDFANRLEKATIDTIESGKMTGDLALITSLPNPKKLNSEEFILAIKETLDMEA